MWIALQEFGRSLESIRDLLEVVLGSLISIAITKYYFRRQLRLELMIRFEKLVRADRRYFLSSLKLREKDTLPDYVKDAMAEYKGYRDVYLPRCVADCSDNQAMQLAQTEIQEHPDRFEPEEQ